jgi:hypothetical protein
MSTAPLTRIGRRPSDQTASEFVRGARHGFCAPGFTAAAVILVVLYAAFAHGAVSLASSTRIELTTCAVAVVGAVAWLGTGALSLAPPQAAWWGVGLLTVFAGWSAATVLWSVAPDRTWIEFNRDLTYVLVVVLGIAVGASSPRAAEFVARGFVVVCAAVTAYALAQKLLPGLHVPGVFDLNQAGPLPRLQEPLGYWNALALFISFGVPIALALVVDVRRSPRRRVLVLDLLVLMLVTIPYTYSRGGLLALAVALAVGILVSGQRLRWLMWLTVAVAFALPGVIVGLTSPQLTRAGVSLADREVAGAVLLAVLGDWDIPAVTLPAMLFLGVLAGGARRRPDKRATIPAPGGGGWRLPLLALLTLWLCAFAVSAELPEAAASRASAALVRASSASPSDLAAAQSSASDAARLDPLSDAGLSVEATIALHRRSAAGAVHYLRDAVRREPSDEQAWNELAYAYLLLGNRGGAAMAARRVVALDPRGSLAAGFARARLLIAPSAGTATPKRTSLPAP